MSVFFSGRELVEVAVDIEKNGVAFYELMGERSNDAGVRSACDHLAGEEREHIKTFEGMLGLLPQQPMPESYPGEQAAYIKALADENVFTARKALADLKEQRPGDAVAIHMAIGMEKDSILFYQEMRGLVRDADRKVVDQVIGEEKAHLTQLSEFLARLGG